MPTLFNIEQGWHAVKANYWIKDLQGNNLYRVEGSNFTWGMQNTLYDKDNKELAKIKQSDVLTLYPKYEVFRDGKKWADCTKENCFGFSKKEALLDIPGDNNYKIRGDRVAQGFTITRTEDGHLVAKLKKESGLRDCYSASVEDGEDIVACILIFALIDGMYQSDKGEDKMWKNLFMPLVSGVADPHA